MDVWRSFNSPLLRSAKIDGFSTSPRTVNTNIVIFLGGVKQVALKRYEFQGLDLSLLKELFGFFSVSEIKTKQEIKNYICHSRPYPVSEKLMSVTLLEEMKLIVIENFEADYADVSEINAFLQLSH